MKTFKDLKEEITRIKNIDHEGFDSDWVLRKFARDQALINIELIKPYTDKYDLIVRFLVTGKDARAAAYAAAAAGAYTAAFAANAAHAAFAAAYDTPAAAAAANAAADADIAAADADIAIDYTKAIESLSTLANEHLALAETEEDLGHNFELGE